jgi:hypothetical protein
MPRPLVRKDEVLVVKDEVRVVNDEPVGKCVFRSS